MGNEGEHGSSDSGAGVDGSGSDDTLDSDATRLDAFANRYVAKLALALLLVVLFVSTAGAVSYVQTYNDVSAEATENLEATTERRAASVGEWRAPLEAQVRDYSAADVYGSGPAATTRYLREAHATAAGPVLALHYVDTSGPEHRVVASTETTAAETGAPRHADWHALVERVASNASATTAVGVSGTAYERDGSLALSVASPVRNASGVLVLVASAAEQRRLLRTSDDETRSMVLNGSGVPVFGADGATADIPVADEKVARARRGIATTDQQGDAVLAYAPVGNTRWVAVTAAEASTLYDTARTVRSAVVLLVGTAVASLALVGVVIGRQTVTPLIELRRRAREMERGNLDVDLETDRDDEVGRLFTSLSSMRDALREQIREAERARRAAERSNRELERQNERLEQFASTLSHDLRNPLTVARGQVELLEAELASLEEADQEALREHTESLERAHDRMEAIIEDVLTLAREGTTVQDPSPVSLREAAEDAWATVDSKGATLTVTADRTVEADRSRLLRALENLFRNAVEHGGADVSVEVGDLDDGFYVADDGPGIDEDAAGDVFDYGYTTSETGTGLGLSIAETIAQAHGWRLYVDTTARDGAMFVFADVTDGEDAADERFEWGGSGER
jgi:signal transduction histidine kinase